MGCRRFQLLLPHFEQASAQGFPVLPPLGQGAFLWWLINWLASAPSRFSSKSLFGEGNFDAPLSIILSFLFSLFLLFLATESVIEAWELTFVLAGLQLAASHTWLPHLASPPLGGFWRAGISQSRRGIWGGGSQQQAVRQLHLFWQGDKSLSEVVLPTLAVLYALPFYALGRVQLSISVLITFLSPPYEPGFALYESNPSFRSAPGGGGVTHPLTPAQIFEANDNAK